MLKNHISKCLMFVMVSFSVHLPIMAQQSTTPGIQMRLSDLLSSPKEEELLEPDQAFKLKVAASGPTTLVVDLIPANGYYLYRERIRFALKNTRGVAIKSVNLPAGKVKNDPTFGKMETYEKHIQAQISLERAPNAKNVTLAANYQGCNEKSGVCYPPMNKEVTLTLP
ncbi:protein-disulfide reductase DsbD N-terminal domain-containing protein [Herbaspirillum sp. GCM10030257]|uniref:protein-disulfide reductase DsbD N-terminal domain-containing protein n=1 Tax=Herbaspirillum sp. GCM10030257 TaxID=3273393 RepID=UPI00360A7005